MTKQKFPKFSMIILLIGTVFMLLGIVGIVFSSISPMILKMKSQYETGGSSYIFYGENADPNANIGLTELNGNTWSFIVATTSNSTGFYNFGPVNFGSSRIGESITVRSGKSGSISDVSSPTTFTIGTYIPDPDIDDGNHVLPDFIDENASMFFILGSGTNLIGIVFALFEIGYFKKIGKS